MAADTDRRRTFTVAGADVTVLRRARPTYGSGNTRASYESAPRVYVSTDAAFDVVEDLNNRGRRPYAAWRPLVQAALVDALAIDWPEHLRLAWSQTAGCGCGCSPGFVLRDARPASRRLRSDVRTLRDALAARADDHGWRYFDVWVTLKGAPAVDDTKTGRGLVTDSGETLETVDQLIDTVALRPSVSA